jgi:hypothetical protein
MQAVLFHAVKRFGSFEKKIQEQLEKYSSLSLLVKSICVIFQLRNTRGFMPVPANTVPMMFCITDTNRCNAMYAAFHIRNFDIHQKMGSMPFLQNLDWL